jgi:hypothetical protein
MGETINKRYEVMTMVNILTFVSYAKTAQSDSGYQRFGGTYYLHFQGGREEYSS